MADGSKLNEFFRRGIRDEGLNRLSKTLPGRARLMLPQFGVDLTRRRWLFIVVCYSCFIGLRLVCCLFSNFESTLSVKLPVDYKKFLRTTNGGIPSPNCFDVPDRGDALCDILYGIRDKRQACDLEWEREQASQWDPLPNGLVAIGRDPGGNTLLLATFGSQAGQVIFWDRNGLWVREDRHNTFPIANSFTAFLAGLREMPIEPNSADIAKKPAKGSRTKRST